MIPARGPQTRFFDILCRFRNAIDATWGRRVYLGAWQILALKVIKATSAYGVISEHGKSWHSSSSMLPGVVGSTSQHGDSWCSGLAMLSGLRWADLGHYLKTENSEIQVSRVRRASLDSSGSTPGSGEPNR